jgi:pyruvate dehydrogenase E2 component (dihydrolipoamide acetyltransferase)
MASEIKLPELGENLEGGEVVAVKVGAGDSVKEGQTLLEVEAEKSTVEVPAPMAGNIAKILVQVGDHITVGHPLFVLEEGKAKESTSGEASAKKKTVEPEHAEEEEAEPSDEGEQVEEEPGKKTAKKERQLSAEKARESAAEEPERAEEQETEPSDDRVEKEDGKKTAKKERRQPEKARKPETEDGKKPETEGRRHAEKETPRPEKDDGKQVKEKETRKPEKVDGKHPASESVPAPARHERLVPAGPATRMLARQLGVDLGGVRGTGPRGRVSQEDVKAFVHNLISGDIPGRAQPALPDFERWGPIERRPLEPIRRRIAEHMSLAWTQIPHVTQHDQADITDLDAFRKEQKAEPKLTVTAFALKAAALALAEFPQFNSSLDAGAGQLVVKNYYHIGVAVDTEHGLLVPVLRDVDKKGVRRLAQELADLAERARNKKLTAEEMRGGTFTITNLGSIGGTAFTPIINYPEVAILGLSRARLEPVVRASQITPRLMLTLSLSYDHRVIDGASAARFTRRLSEFLENPLRMLL